MQVSRISSEKLKHQFKITVPARDLEEKFDQQLEKIGARVRIPGFRSGKTPRSILVQRYGAEVWEDTGNAVLREALKQIYREHKFRNAIDPIVNIISFEKDKDFECTVTFEILPDIDVKSFKGISLEILNVAITDEDIEKRLQKMCDEHIKYQEPSQTRPAAKRDLIWVKWSGTLEDGKRIEIPETYQILLGPEKKESPFAPVVKALYGKGIGDHFEEKIRFSHQEKVAELADKEATVKVEVQKIEEPITFQLDDTFAKEYNLETLEELRKTVRSTMEYESKKVAYLYTKRNLLDALDAQYNFDLPPTMVENEFKAIWEQLKNELNEAQVNGELDEEESHKSENELKTEYEFIAKRRVRLGLLIAQLADLNKLKLTDEEVRRAVVNEAMRHPSQMDEVIKFYGNNHQALRNLVAPLLEDKVVDFVLKESAVVEREVDFSTLKKIVQGIIPTPYDEEVEEGQSSVI